ncbi:MAG: ribonuclease H family protein [Aeromonas salmonicida]
MSNALKKLRNVFATAPLLVHLDTGKPFVVEVDVSTSGVGAVLSQQQRTPPRLHPCAYFSRKMTPAIKLAFGKWWHSVKVLDC